MQRKLALASLVLTSFAVNCSSTDAGSGGAAGASTGQAGAVGSSAGAIASAAGSGDVGNGTAGSPAASAGTGNAGATSGDAAAGTGGSASGVSGGGGGGAGASASAGTAGTPDGGVTGGGTPTACPSNVVFCDDFESYAALAQPSGQWKTTTVGNGSLVVDTTHAFSGTKAAHIHGTVSQHTNKEQVFMVAQNAPAFPVSGPTFFLRFMIYGTRYPFTGVTDPNHIALAWVGSKTAMVNPDQGDPGHAYMLSDYNGVSIEPQWSGYYRDTTTHFKDAKQANGWHCWEVEMSNTGGPPPGGATGVASFHIWEDGTELKLSEKGGGNYPAISFEALMFALYSPQTDVAPADMWIDDVAVSKSRINCPLAK
jgi:hypothetical protein